MNENEPAPPGDGPIDSEAAETSSGGAPPSSFAALELGPEVLHALTDMGFAEPMQVQSAVIPLVLTGRDLMVQSRTGSGKTAAFGIPLVDKIVNPEDKFVQAIVLLPTRELALQVAGELARIAAYRPIDVVPVYGGAPMGRQIEQLRAGGQMVCGTPGRVLDHLRRGTLVLDRVRCVVLDECDEMLSMGFQEDIEAIVERTPVERQTLLFSATVPEGIQRLSRRFLRDPEMIKLSADFVGVHEIRHVYYAITGGNRESELLRVLEFENPGRAIVFCNTREETGRVAEFLRRQGFEAEAISSDLSQMDRERVMARMRAGELRFLVATDVAARGIDLEALTHVINYTFPESPEVYIHRTGRTGRAGRHGTAISLIGPTEVGPFYYVKLLYKIRPEERSLPSEAEIRAKREGERIQTLRTRLVRDPGPLWRSLARRLMSALDGEQLCAALLAEAFEREAGSSAAPRVEPVARSAPPVSIRSVEGSAPPKPRSDRGERGERPGRERYREDRERGRRPRRDGPPDRPSGERLSSPEERKRRERRPASEDRPSPPPLSAREPERSAREPERSAREPERSAREPERSAREPERRPRAAAVGERDFWSVWREDEGPTTVSPAPSTDEPPTAPASLSAAAPSSDQARLFLNLGRKDDATAEEVAGLFRELGVSVPPQDIEVMNTHSYINVPPSDAERLCTSLSGRERQGRTLSCEPARPRRR
jgi:ATP-dependent RNA helicase DeaD